MGQLLAIAQRAKKRAEMQLLTTAQITLERGVEQDFRGKPGKRQVTVLTQEGWDAACTELNAKLAWTDRRANLLIEGIDLQNSGGKILCIGTSRLLITQETDPCKRMNEVFPGLEKALATTWRGGVCCRVLSAGHISLGDQVSLSDA